MGCAGESSGSRSRTVPTLSWRSSSSSDRGVSRLPRQWPSAAPAAMIRAMTFDEALGVLLALVGERVEVHVLDAGESPHLVATFGGRLQAGYSMTGGEPSDTEAIFVRLDAGRETAAISLDREVFEGAIRHEDGAISLRLGGVELLVARRD